MEVFAQNAILAFAALVTAFVITCFTIHLVIRLSHHLELFDPPDDRKIHSGKISRLGGIGIFIGFVISVGLSPLIIGFWLRSPFIVYAKVLPKISFIIPTLMIFTVGLLDDFLQLKARWKLIVQIIAATIVVAAGGRINVLALPFSDIVLDLGNWSVPVSFLWIIGVTNAMNLIDGMDGLSASIGAVAFAVYGIAFMLGNHFILGIISLVLVGTLWGYLMFNYPPARIFMGDSGSLVIGFLLAVLPLVANDRGGTIMYMPVTLLILPITDVFSALFRRIRRRIPFTRPDKEHIHHKLLELGFRERAILMMVTGLMCVSSIPVILLSEIPFRKLSPVLVSIWILFYMAYAVIGALFRRRKRSRDNQ